VKLGVTIEPKGHGLTVNGVEKNSPAQTTGLQDLLVPILVGSTEDLFHSKCSLAHVIRGWSNPAPES
jgi:hypothetical protein